MKVNINEEMEMKNINKQSYWKDLEICFYKIF